MRGADRQSRHAALDERKVDELGQRLLQRRCRVVAGLVPPRAGNARRERERIGLEESPECRRARWTNRTTVSDSPGQVQNARTSVAPHPAPEFLQPVQAILRLVAGDQAGVDGADRGADDPVGLDAGFVQAPDRPRPDRRRARRRPGTRGRSGVASAPASRPARECLTASAIGGAVTSSILFTWSSKTAPRRRHLRAPHRDTL